MIFRDNHRSFLVLELITGYINYQTRSLKPRMGAAFSFSSYVVKIAVAILRKVLRKEAGRISTSAQGKIVKSDEQECYRICLYNCGAKGGDVLEEVVYFKIDELRGEIFVNVSYPYHLKCPEVSA